MCFKTNTQEKNVQSQFSKLLSSKRICGIDEKAGILCINKTASGWAKQMDIKSTMRTLHLTYLDYGLGNPIYENLC